MRLSDASVTALPRDVVSTAGLTLDNAVTIPKGKRCVFPTKAMHLDQDYYPHAERYDVFRFSRPFEASSPQAARDGRALATSVNRFVFCIWI